jgi:hypothetical protein
MEEIKAAVKKEKKDYYKKHCAEKNRSMSNLIEVALDYYCKVYKLSEERK